MAEIIQFMTKCPKCTDGFMIARSGVRALCVYCTGRIFIKPEEAKAIRQADRETAAFWCDCPDMTGEVTFNRHGIFCAECEKQIQEDFWEGRA